MKQIDKPQNALELIDTIMECSDIKEHAMDYISIIQDYITDEILTLNDELMDKVSIEKWQIRIFSFLNAICNIFHDYCSDLSYGDCLYNENEYFYHMAIQMYFDEINHYIIDGNGISITYAPLVELYNWYEAVYSGYDEDYSEDKDLHYYCQKAVEKGILVKTEAGYKRNNITKALLVYFLDKFRNSDGTFPDKKYSMMFGETRLSKAYSQLINNKNGDGRPKGYEIIDALLKE